MFTVDRQQTRRNRAVRSGTETDRRSLARELTLEQPRLRRNDKWSNCLIQKGRNQERPIRGTKSTPFERSGTLVDESAGWFLCSEVFSSVEMGIKRPFSRAYHCGGSSESGQ